MNTTYYDYIHNILDENLQMRLEQMLDMIGVCFDHDEDLNRIHGYITAYHNAKEALAAFEACVERYEAKEALKVFENEHDEKEEKHDDIHIGSDDGH